MNDAPTGNYRVVIKFTIDPEGRSSNFKFDSNNGYGMEAEVLRVLSKIKNWKPAKKDGKPVKSIRRQAITFIVKGQTSFINF